MIRKRYDDQQNGTRHPPVDEALHGASFVFYCAFLQLYDVFQPRKSSPVDPWMVACVRAACVGAWTPFTLRCRYTLTYVSPCALAKYELGDLSLALDSLSKELTCELTGKDNYEFGDLSKELDKRVKAAVADFCGKESYHFGDLSKEIDRRIKDRVAEFTQSDEPYEFGDITRAINERRKKWMAETLGEEAAANYQFGDISKKILSNYLGEEKAANYQFGDVTKKLIGDLFAGKKKKGE